jgi:hypothetical protein
VLSTAHPRLRITLGIVVVVCGLFLLNAIYALFFYPTWDAVIVTITVFFTFIGLLVLLMGFFLLFHPTRR